MFKVSLAERFLIACLPVMCLLGFIVSTALVIGCVPKDATPAEKVAYVTMDTLEVAKTFRDYGLQSARIFWMNGLMPEATAAKLTLLGNDFQAAINEASEALEVYQKSTTDANAVTLEEKMQAYYKAYAAFMELITPYLMDKEVP